MKTAVAGAPMPDDGRAEWPDLEPLSIGDGYYQSAQRDDASPIFRDLAIYTWPLGPWTNEGLWAR